MNKTNWLIGGVAILALILSIFAFSNNPGGDETSTTSFDKVLSSGIIRAGYIIYPPYFIKDPNTGEFSGIFHDLTTELASQLELDVEWIEEAGYGTIFSSLSSGRYDVFAGGLWANSTRAKAGYLTSSAFYNAVYAYVRAGDFRFDNNLNAINSSNVRISTMDGELGSVIAKSDFPNAEEVSLPQTAPFDQMALQVIANKADIVFLQPDSAGLFLEANPGTLRRVPSEPLRLYGNAYAVKLGESALQQMIDVALQEAINSGTVDKILTKYQSSANSYLRAAAPYTE